MSYHVRTNIIVMSFSLTTGRGHVHNSILERGLEDLPWVIGLATLVVDEDLQLDPVLDPGHPPQVLPQLLLVLLLEEAEEDDDLPDPPLQVTWLLQR